MGVDVREGSGSVKGGALMSADNMPAPHRHDPYDGIARRLADAATRAGALDELTMRGLDIYRVVPVSVRGEHVVHIDGKPYAAFRDAKSADDACDAWAKSWPAAQGRTLSVGRVS